MHRQARLRSWVLRLAAAYGVVVLAAWLLGAWYGEALLPLYKIIAQWMCPDYHVLGFHLVRENAEPRFELAAVSYRHQIVSGFQLPPGFYVTSSTLLGHALQHPVVIYTVLGAWPGLRTLNRLGLFVVAIPFLLVVECVDVPVVIAGNVHASLLENVAPLEVGRSGLVWWIDFLGGGGRLAISFAAAFAALAAFRSIRSALRRFRCPARMERND